MEYEDAPRGSAGLVAPAPGTSPLGPGTVMEYEDAPRGSAGLVAPAPAASLGVSPLGATILECEAPAAALPRVMQRRADEPGRPAPGQQGGPLSLAHVARAAALAQRAQRRGRPGLP